MEGKVRTSLILTDGLVAGLNFFGLISSIHDGHYQNKASK